MNVESVDEAVHLSYPSSKAPGDRDDDGFKACHQEIARLYKKTDTTMTRTQKDITVKLASEVEHYILPDSTSERDKCALQYWKHEKKFLLLKQSAVEYLCTYIITA